jgi:hypothetical protein
MSAALAVVAAVALVAIVAVVLTIRKGRAQVAAERARADGLADQLRSSLEAGADAEHRAEQAQLALGAAVERADQLERRAAEGPDRLDAVRTLWELERIRLEREWAEVTGSTTPLPEPWDGRIRAALAVELELIREVIGVPSRLEPAITTGPDDPLTTMATFRLAAEGLRALARVGEEIVVSFEADGAIIMTIATEGAGAEPHLGRVSDAATDMGGELAVLPTGDGLRARLCLPASTG